MEKITKRDQVLKLFDDLETAKILDCNFYRQECGSCYKDHAGAIAANNKWWIGDIEKHMTGCEFAGNNLCDTIDCPTDKFTEHCPWWQQIKKETTE